ncbi:MAG: 16S rRNA (guanine(966)-N(2))-methyltransferase RsmD [Phormidesmis priestleyi Ana]|uniref:16S rRNA (Guanine(966)-N(2))-methyltransferase RsmD n=1 Tax=Phormidesmis priestleyi Ana TaxID=1666911 RepID=A0A0P7YZT5_9CYAN|nr:MAG: 16S rRNA (guanine(966)-N(2))-methyltransferase RsmD [Phormidesmis priestleyi Ana]
MAVRIYGNREIKTLPGEATRPTSARVREALFNIWQGRVLGCRWLDLCAGSGAMGAEALCRGATAVVGIEASGAACDVIGHNWQKVAKPAQLFQVVKGDVVQQLKRMTANTNMAPFDLVYFDPPYAADLYSPVLTLIADCLGPQGEAAIEYSAAHWQPGHLPLNLEIVKEKRYGSTSLVFVRRVNR